MLLTISHSTKNYTFLTANLILFLTNTVFMKFLPIFNLSYKPQQSNTIKKFPRLTYALNKPTHHLISQTNYL